MSLSKRKLFLLLVYLLPLSLLAQTSSLDSSVYNKVGNYKNAVYLEALGSSSLAGVFYQRSVPLAHNIFHIRFNVGFSPFTFFRFSFSDGVSVPMGVGFYFLKGRFKIGASFMIMHSFYFQPIEVKDFGYSPVKITYTSYKLFLQPQLNFEYHFSKRILASLSFTPTLQPELVQDKREYSFMPWGGLTVGYKF